LIQIGDQSSKIKLRTNNSKKYEKKTNEDDKTTTRLLIGKRRGRQSRTA